MYSTVLILHSWLRWMAILAGLAATFSAMGAASRVGAKDPADRWSLIFSILLDLQFLLGSLLYVVLSPTTAAIFDDFGAAMKDPVARFWAVEHVTMMLVALVMVHVGRGMAAKAKTPAAKRTRMLICFGIATLAMLAATPWPGMRAGRPLFRV